MPPAPSRLKRGRLRDRGDGAMLITVTFRHVDPTPPLKAYAEEKLQRVRKYLHRPVDAHVILSVSKERHVAEITLKADHVTMFAEEETHDLYSAIDLAIDKLEHQAQKLHEKRRHHKGAAAVRDVSEVTTSVLAADRRRPGGAPEVIRTQRLPAKPLAVEEAVEQLAGAVARRYREEVDRAKLVQALEDREKLNSTALGEGVAIPHGKLPGLRRVIAAFGRSPGGVDFSSLDGKPTHLFFLLVAPEDSAGAHLKALARISRLLKDESFRQRLMRATTAADLYRTIREEDDKY